MVSLQVSSSTSFVYQILPKEWPQTVFLGSLLQSLTTRKILTTSFSQSTYLAEVKTLMPLPKLESQEPPGPPVGGRGTR